MSILVSSLINRCNRCQMASCKHLSARWSPSRWNKFRVPSFPKLPVDLSMLCCLLQVASFIRLVEMTLASLVVSNKLPQSSIWRTITAKKQALIKQAQIISVLHKWSLLSWIWKWRIFNADPTIISSSECWEIAQLPQWLVRIQWEEYFKVH